MSKSPISTYSDEDFLKIVIQSKSKTEIAFKMGIKSTGAIRRRLSKLENCYTDHLFKRRQALYTEISIPELTEIVKNAKTWTQIMDKIGCRSKNKDLRAYLESKSISYSHLATGVDWYHTENGRHVNQITGEKRSIPLEQILVQDAGPIRGIDLKRKLIRAGLMMDQCAECGLPPVWQGEPLTLQLDHTNGIHNDNSFGNLRILCPNCHSQTDTFSGRNEEYIDRKNGTKDLSKN